MHAGIEVKKVIDYKVMLDEAMEIAQFKVPQSVVFQRPQSTATLQAGRDRDWEVHRTRVYECTLIV